MLNVCPFIVILDIIKKLKSKFQLDKNETLFIQRLNQKNYKSKKISTAVLMNKDYYFLIQLHFLINQKNIDSNSIIAIWPYNIYFKGVKSSNLVSYIKFKIINFLEKKKC